MKFFGEVEGKNCVWGETFCREARWKIGTGEVGAAKRWGSFKFQVSRFLKLKSRGDVGNGIYRSREGQDVDGRVCGLRAGVLVGWGAVIIWEGRRVCGSGRAVAVCGNIVRRVDGRVGHVPVGGV